MREAIESAAPWRSQGGTGVLNTFQTLQTSSRRNLRQPSRIISGRPLDARVYPLNGQFYCPQTTPKLQFCLGVPAFLASRRRLLLRRFKSKIIKLPWFSATSALSDFWYFEGSRKENINYRWEVLQNMSFGKIFSIFIFKDRSLKTCKKHVLVTFLMIGFRNKWKTIGFSSFRCWGSWLPRWSQVGSKKAKTSPK